jgi:ring-1,2-phenylacetyl-CoA epoxidase subunit PaaA
VTTVSEAPPLPVIPEAPEGVWHRCELERLGVDGYDEGDDLPEEFRTLIMQIVTVQVDLESELVFDSAFFRNYMLAAADPKGRMRMAKFYAEEVSHGFTFWKIAKGLGMEFTARYFKEAKRKRQEAFNYAAAVEDWTELAVVNTLTDRMGVFVFYDMADCAYRPWAAVSAKVARDEVGHSALGFANLREEIRLGKREKAQAYLDKWYPMALDMFGRTGSTRQWRYIAWGIKKSPNEGLRQAWKAEVDPLLKTLDLAVPGYYENRKFL